MTKSAQISSPAYEISETGEREICIYLKGRLDSLRSADVRRRLETLFKKKNPRSVAVDLKAVTYLDDFGAFVLSEIRERVGTAGGEFRLLNVPEKVGAILALVNFDDQTVCETLEGKKRPNFVVRLGGATLHVAFNARYLASFLGSVIVSFFYAVFHPRSVRWNDVLTYMEKTGVDAVPIVALISFLLGLVMAFTSALQLKQFGANIYVASLVALAMVSELGPIMTAIVVAGRSGSAFAAEIGTMRISEEIDALYIMGFRPTLFLAVPRVLASVLVVPLLTLFSDIFAIAGGLVVGVTILNLTPGSYIDQTIKTLTLFEVMWGLMKSVVFAATIGWVGCLRGFQVRGGAAAVGSAATSAVVTSIFLIILFDSVFAVIRSYW